MTMLATPEAAKAATPPPGIGDEEGLPAPRRYIAAAAAFVALGLVVLDGAIANVALPTISAKLQVSAAASVWIVTSYQTALVVSLLPLAAWAESVGYRRVFTLGVVVFTLASLLCALSPSLPWLAGARFLQGLGGGGIMSLTVALMRFTFPHRRLGAIIGAVAVTVALGGAAGPSIGAAILAVANWPWLFAVNLPLGVVALALTRALPDPRGSRRPLDFVSVALNIGVFAPLVIGGEIAVAFPWRCAGLLAVSGMCLVALMRREAPRPAPLFPLDLLRGRSFRISILASICCFAAQMSSMVALPFYFQHAWGLSATLTGLCMTPWPLTVAIAGPVSGRLSDRVGTAWLCAAGAGTLSVGVALVSIWPLGGGLGPLVFITMLSGLGFGFFQVPNNRNMLISAPRERSGAAGGMQGLARLTGQTLGGVLATLLFQIFSDSLAPRWGLAFASALALAAALISTMRTGEEPSAPSPAPRIG